MSGRQVEVDDFGNEYVPETPPDSARDSEDGFDPLKTPPILPTGDRLSLGNLPAVGQFTGVSQLIPGDQHVSPNSSALKSASVEKEISQPNLSPPPSLLPISSSDELRPSSHAKLSMGKHVPVNTQRSNRNGFRLLPQYVLSLINSATSDSQYAASAAAAVSKAAESAPGANKLERSLMAVLLDDRDAKKGFDNSCLVRLRHFLIEFGTSYVSPRTSAEVMPSTMHTYIRGVQRRLGELGFTVDPFSGPIFNHPQHGLKAAMDNKFSLQ